MSLVFVTAKTRPAASALRLTWSSLFHPVGTFSSVQAPSPAPRPGESRTSCGGPASLSYMTPIRSPPKCTTAEMSSESSAGVPGIDEGRAPGGVVTADGPVDVHARALGPGGPEGPGRVAVDGQRLGRGAVDRRGEASVQRVAVARRVEAVAPQLGAVGRGGRRARGAAEDVRGDVELVVSGVEEGVGPGRAARIDGDAGVDPPLRGPVQAMDPVLAGRCDEQRRPPLPVGVPELALGLVARRRVAERRVAEVLGPGVGPPRPARPRRTRTRPLRGPR